MLKLAIQMYYLPAIELLISAKTCAKRTIAIGIALLILDNL